MCGRYVLKSSLQRLREAFGIELQGGNHSETWRPRYNIAPGQVAPVVRTIDGRRHLDMLRWGLIPSWAKEPQLGNRLINARSETVAEKPAFRAAFRSRRCIVPADGFYEWQQQAAGKQPFYIHRKDGALLAIAGLWEHWTAPGTQDVVETFTILTTEANAWMRPLHARMPVVLQDDALARWLNPRSKSDDLQTLLGQTTEGGWEAYPVSRAVSSVRNDTEDLLERVG